VRELGSECVTELARLGSAAARAMPRCRWESQARSEFDFWVLVLGRGADLSPLGASWQSARVGQRRTYIFKSLNKEKIAIYSD
jgi:hypothetical protein